MLLGELLSALQHHRRARVPCNVLLQAQGPFCRSRAANSQALRVGAVVDSTELASFNGRFIQVFSYARLGGLHYAHPLDLVVMLARPSCRGPGNALRHFRALTLNGIDHSRSAGVQYASLARFAKAHSQATRFRLQLG